MLLAVPGSVVVAFCYLPSWLLLKMYRVKVVEAAERPTDGGFCPPLLKTDILIVHQSSHNMLLAVPWNVAVAFCYLPSRLLLKMYQMQVVEAAERQTVGICPPLLKTDIGHGGGAFFSCSFSVTLEMVVIK